MQDTIIYLGPTFPVEQAQTILPGNYHAPVRCGDVLRARPLRPRAIVIIDGVFEHTGAVWHKEILLALQDGIAVYGASSMGALRAAECEAFGMIGVGKIFDAYSSGEYVDDDEVAVMHGTGLEAWRAATVPLVNIRSTVEQAVCRGLLDVVEAEAVVSHARNIFYQERTMAAVKAKLDNEDAALARRFRHVIIGGGYIDQKRLDAIAVLKCVAAGEPSTATTHVVNRNVHTRRIESEVMCRPFGRRVDWLPDIEQTTLDCRLLGTTYLMLKMLAELLMMVEAAARLRSVTPCANDYCAARREAGLVLMVGRRRDDFVERVACMNALTRLGENADIRDANEYQRDVLRLFGRYGRTVPGDAISILASRVAQAWRIVDGAVIDADMDISDNRLAIMAEEFRIEQGLHTRAATLQWMARNELDSEGFTELIAAFGRYSTMIDGNWAHCLGVDDATDGVAWLCDAVALSPYDKLLATIDEASDTERGLSALVQQHCEQLGDPLPSDLETYAHMLDFRDGERDLLAELRRWYRNAAPMRVSLSA